MPDRPTAVITGGNAGIGAATARALVAQGWRVVLTGRNEAALATAAAELSGGKGDVAWRLGDFASLAAVRGLAEALAAEPRIDALINNAGVAISDRRVTGDGNELVLQVNHLAPFLLTSLLLDKLRASAPARVINLSSRMHRMVAHAWLDDLQLEHGFATRRAYARSKLYALYFTRALARRLEGSGVTVNAVHPGGIRSRIGRDGDMRGLAGLLYRLASRTMAPPEQAGAMIAGLATDPALASVTGRYFGSDGRETEPSALARDDDAAERLWAISAQLVGLEDAPA